MPCVLLDLPELMCAVNVPYRLSRYAPKWAFLIPYSSASVRAWLRQAVDFIGGDEILEALFSLTTNQKAGSSNLSGRAI